MSPRPAHPELPGLLLSDDEVLEDVEQHWPVVESTRPYESPFVSVREDRVRAPDDGEVHRTTVEHPGAVAVVAVDDTGRILLLRQYRHPVGRRLLEIPAGLLDVDGESPRDAAARELAEESDLVAAHWERLVEMFSSPGFTDERVRIYRATGLTAVPEADRTTRAAEEADMDAVWAPLDDAVAAVLDGRMNNSLAICGVLAAAVART